MGCCHSSANANSAKSPEKVPNNEYVEDEKEGDRIARLESIPPSVQRDLNKSPSGQLNPNKEATPQDILRRNSSKMDLNDKKTNNGIGIFPSTPLLKKNGYLDPDARPSYFDQSQDLDKRVKRNIGSFNESNDLLNLKESKAGVGISELINRPVSGELTLPLSKENHELILKFVGEQIQCIQNNLGVLYHNLNMNGKEDENLPLIITELKTEGKDLENCMDDLMSHPFDKENELKSEIKRECNLIKHVVFEYGTVEKNLTSYPDFRERILAALLNFDKNIAFQPMARGRGYSYKGGFDEKLQSITFIPREDSRIYEESQNQIFENQIDLRLEIK